MLEYWIRRNVERLNYCKAHNYPVWYKNQRGYVIDTDELNITGTIKFDDGNIETVPAQQVEQALELDDEIFERFIELMENEYLSNPYVIRKKNSKIKYTLYIENAELSID